LRGSFGLLADREAILMIAQICMEYWQLLLSGFVAGLVGSAVGNFLRMRRK